MPVSQMYYHPRALTELNKIAQSLIDIEKYPDTKNLLKQIAESAKEVLKADVIELYEYRQDQNKFELPQISAGEKLDLSVRKDVIYLDDSVAQLIRNKEPLYAKNAQVKGLVFTDRYKIRRKDQPSKRFVFRENILSSATIPLRAENENMGLMFVNYRTFQAFSEEQKELIELFGSHAAIAIKNARLFRQEHDKTIALKELNQLTHRLVSIQDSPDPTDLLKKIAESALNVLKADLIELYEYESTKREFKLPHIWVGKKLLKELTPRKIHPDDAIFQVIQEPKPFYEADAQSEDSIFTTPFKIKRENLSKQRFAVRENIKSTAAIPLKTETEILGLMFANYRKTQSFPAEQQELIELFANQAAIAIKNAQLYQYVNKRREALVSVGQKLTASIQLSEEEILESIYEQASIQLGMKTLSIALYNEKTGTVHFALAALEGKRIDTKKEPGWESRQGGEGKTEKVIRERKFWLIPTIEEVKEAGYSAVPGDKNSESKIANSWLGVPMIVGDKVLGVIAIEHYGKDYFYRNEDVEILQALADQAAIAIDNARLNERLNKVNQRQRILIEIGQKLKEKIYWPVGEILDLFYEQVSKELGMENLSIALYDDVTDTTEWALAVINGRRVDVENEEGWEPRQGGSGKTEWIIRNKHHLLLASQKELKERRFSPVPGREPKPGDVIPNGWLGVPMMMGSNVLGVIANYDYGNDFAYDEDDIKILQALANQAAIAIHNARFYSTLSRKYTRVNRYQRSLIQFGKQLSSKIKEGEIGILNFIYKQANQFMDTDNMYIALYDEKKEEASFPLIFQDGVPIKVEPRKSGKGRTEEIIRTGKPIFINTKKEAEEWYQQAGREEYTGKISASWIGVPMKLGNKNIGVVATYHPTDDYVYSEDDLKILQAMADQATVAIENAKLYSEMDRRVKERTEEATKAERERIEAEKWAYLGRLAGSLAHRIGNKGGMIRLCVQDLKDYFKNKKIIDKDITKQLEIIARNNQYLLSLSDSLFKPRKAIEEGLKATDVLHYLEDAKRYAELSEDIIIEQNYPDNLPRVFGNKYLVEVFLEIISNAAEAMLGSKEKKLIINISRTDNHVEIRFQDTGRGITPDEEEIIFELFSSISEGVSGKEHQGFGLWWVSTFLKDIGGNLRYEKPSVKGAIFIVELPITEVNNEK